MLVCSRCRCNRPLNHYNGVRGRVKTCIKCRAYTKNRPPRSAIANAGYAQAFALANPNYYVGRDRKASNRKYYIANKGIANKRIKNTQQRAPLRPLVA